MERVSRRGQRVQYESGYRFPDSRLTVVKRAGSDAKRNTLVLVRCDCGVEKTIRASKAASGEIVSCGCYAREQNLTRSLKHGHARPGHESPEWKAWSAMKVRVPVHRGKAHLIVPRGMRVSHITQIEAFTGGAETIVSAGPASDVSNIHCHEGIRFDRVPNSFWVDDFVEAELVPNR